GGLLSAASSLLFVLRSVPWWWRVQTGGSAPLLALTALGIAAIAAVIESWPTGGVVAESPSERQVLQSRFEQGALMLHAKQYEHAMTAFHWVLKQAPRMPEAHVNMGYALLGLGRIKAAEDFFQSAIALRPFQANAYFGLAESLEARGELRGALGAMRSFIHLTRQDDPHLPRARAALWEWESRLQTAAGGGEKSPAPAPEAIPTPAPAVTGAPRTGTAGEPSAPPGSRAAP
ncbi:MAG: tetratricopeptide repeat protein, partial [Magnetococcales bacterium]|nr:tetratricopeptide repeat protein [Magnetococcales bacterium]